LQEGGVKPRTVAVTVASMVWLLSVIIAASGIVS
jgi:hypothetical protein